MMNRIEVIGLGALNADYIYNVDRILADGETIIEDAVMFPGGSAANTICGLARLGISTGFIGATGDDADGQLVRQDLQDAGVDTSRIKIKSGDRTGLAWCLSDKLGRRAIYILAGANGLLGVDDVDISYVNQARILHVSSFAGDRQFQLLPELINKLAPSVKLSLAPGAFYAARGLEALRPILAHTHVLIINHDEIEQLTGKDVKTGAEICLKAGCRIVAVTMGKGDHETIKATSYIRDADNEYLVIPLGKDKVTIVDGVGAGDAFAAGFLFGLLKDKPPQECGQLGDITARSSLAGAGARPGLPTLGELSERYQQLYGKPL